MDDVKQPGPDETRSRCPEVLHCHEATGHDGPHLAVAGGDSTHEWQTESEFSSDAMDWTPVPDMPEAASPSNADCGPDETRSEPERLRQQLVMAEASNNELRVERARLQRENEQLRDENETRRQENIKLSGEVPALLVERNRLQERADRLREAVEALADEYAKHEGMFDQTMDTEFHRGADYALVKVAKELRAALAAGGSR